MISRSSAGTVTPAQPVVTREPKVRSLYVSTISGLHHERIAIDVTGLFTQSDHRKRYLVIAMDYFTKQPESYAAPNQEPSTVAEALVTNLF
jgi:hypothetical protein